MRSTLGTLLPALVLATAALTPSAQAEPTDPGTPSSGEVRAAQDRAQAALTDVETVQQELDDAIAEVDAASVAAAKAAEAYNGARWKAAEARRAEKRALRKAAAADRALEVQEAGYRDVVLTAYNGGLEITAFNALVTADGMESLVDRSAAIDHVEGLLDQQQEAYTDAASAAEDAASAAEEATEEADAALDEARAARDAAEAAATAASDAAARIEGRKARLVRKLARLQGISVELAQSRQDTLEAERQAARLAPAPARDRAADPAPVRDDPAPDPAPDPDPAPAVPKDDPAPVVPDDPPAADRGGARAAIAYAREQLGERYVWGAAGPSSWDCSGLTSKAWEAGGKYLPHYSVAQYEQSTPISAGQLRPGDLVFWSDGGSPSSIFHVALYTGGGQIIHAPRTGKPVTEESMYYWRLPDFYARP